MALKETIKTMHKLLEEITKDLRKSERNNKAASQRVRTGTIKLAKISKKYRKESVLEEKKRQSASKKSKKKSTKKKRV